MRSNIRRKQHGLSLISGVLLLLVVIVLGTAAFRMVPAYMEYSTVRSAINATLNDSRTSQLSPREIRDALARRFSINQVTVINANDVGVSREGGTLTMAVDYEVREPLFYNVSIVMTFERQFSKDVRQ